MYNYNYIILVVLQSLVTRVTSLTQINTPPISDRQGGSSGKYALLSNSKYS